MFFFNVIPALRLMPHLLLTGLSMPGMVMPGMATGNAVTLRATYDPWYVALSIALAVLSAYAALDLAARVQQSRASGTRTIWLFCGALALGSGIWSMHYVGMLAFRLPVAVEYDEAEVALSLLAAVVASGLALFLAARRTMNVLTTAMGSICMGSGIAAMHYIGMAAMRTAAMPMYSTGTVALSIALAVVIAFVALRATFAHRHVTHAFTVRKAALALILGGAIPSVHYVGMAAATWQTMNIAMPDKHVVVFRLWGVLAVPGLACLLLMFLVRMNATVDRTFTEHLLQQRASEERYRNILSSAFDAFIGVSPSGTITDWNAQAERTFNWTASEAVGQSIDDVLMLPGRANTRFSHFLNTHARNEVEGRLEVEGRRRNGSSFAGEMALSVLEVDGGLMVAAFVHDVTERKLAEQQTLESRRAAEAANRAKSEFLANMSHEIRTPLNGIIGMNELVLDSDLTAEQRECLETVRLSADLLLSVITDILDFSKIEAGRMELEHVRFDLRECMETTVKTLALRADEKGLELLCDVGLDVPDAVFGDPARLRQVLTNLVGNAIKFTADGEVMVQARTVAADETTDGPAMIHFTVSDTGIGIAPGKVTTIFEPFLQADTSTTRQFGGTGLGLTISRHMVEMMHGRLWVESELGRGSHFHVEVPMEIAPAIASVAVEPGACASMDGVKALIIDDNATNRRIMEGLMNRWRMDAVSVADGPSGLSLLHREAAKGRPFRLVLTDVHMPEMDGFTFVQELKKQPGMEPPTIMMLSSGGQRGDAERCRELGVAAYLLKPVRHRELQDAIARALHLMLPEEPAMEAVAEDTEPVEVVGTVLNALDVLLAEDNEVNRKLAVRLLERRGHTVTIAGNGREAEHAIAERAKVGREFDLVLMDVQMPEMSGTEATAAVRAREAAEGAVRHQHIVAMTALVMTGDRERCIQAGMDDYISKPFRTEELEAVLDRALEQKQARAKATRRSSQARPAVVEVSADNCETLDAADLMARVDGDMDLVQELATILREDSPEKLNALRTASQTHHALSLQAVAHSLKGALAVLGARRATAQAAELERMGREGRPQGVELLVDRLSDEIQAVQQQLMLLCEKSAEVAL